MHRGMIRARGGDAGAVTRLLLRAAWRVGRVSSVAAGVVWQHVPANRATRPASTRVGGADRWDLAAHGPAGRESRWGVARMAAHAARCAGRSMIGLAAPLGPTQARVRGGSARRLYTQCSARSATGVAECPVGQSTGRTAFGLGSPGPRRMFLRQEGMIGRKSKEAARP